MWYIDDDDNEKDGSNEMVMCFDTMCAFVFVFVVLCLVLVWRMGGWWKWGCEGMNEREGENKGARNVRENEIELVLVKMGPFY